MKEFRGVTLVSLIKEHLPNVGKVKIESKDGRKASFEWRGIPYIVTSRLIVREQGLGNSRLKGIETADSVNIQERLQKF